MDRSSPAVSDTDGFAVGGTVLAAIGGAARSRPCTPVTVERARLSQPRTGQRVGQPAGPRVEAEMVPPGDGGALVTVPSRPKPPVEQQVTVDLKPDTMQGGTVRVGQLRT
jgi:hypothetical protein